MDSAGIWLPPKLNDEPKPLKCRICQQRFARDSQLIAHIERCYSRIENEVREVVAEHKQGHMDVPDPEWEAYNQALRAAGRDPMEQYNRGRKSNIRRAGES